jgi:beta-N-acetylhexosaminidase
MVTSALIRTSVYPPIRVLDCSSKMLCCRFVAPLAQGVGGVMIGHIALPEIDSSGAPASLSRNVVTGILRDELRFRGLVFTDDLAMKALPQNAPGQVAIQAP